MTAKSLETRLEIALLDVTTARKRADTVERQRDEHKAELDAIDEALMVSADPWRKGDESRALAVERMLSCIEDLSDAFLAIQETLDLGDDVIDPIVPGFVDAVTARFKEMKAHIAALREIAQKHGASGSLDDTATIAREHDEMLVRVAYDVTCSGDGKGVVSPVEEVVEQVLGNRYFPELINVLAADVGAAVTHDPVSGCPCCLRMTDALSATLAERRPLDARVWDSVADLVEETDLSNGYSPYRASGDEIRAANPFSEGEK